jgi:nucleoside transporter
MTTENNAFADYQRTSLKTSASLALMMFMQYMLISVWWVQLASFLQKASFDGAPADPVMHWLILSTMAIGSMCSPVIGGLAGRYFSSQKVLMVANLLTAVFLYGATQMSSSLAFFVFIQLAMLCYMPTWSLTSFIAMEHADPKVFPRIRMFGSIGWVASGLFTLFATKNISLMLPFAIDDTPVTLSLCHWELAKEFDGTWLPIYCGSAVALVAAVLNMTLPDTPPKPGDGKFSIPELLGLRAFSMLRDRNYLLFVIGSVWATLAFTLYFNLGSRAFNDAGFKDTTITMNWGQAAELLFLFLTTTIMMRFGVKKALLLGLLAMVLRYFLFYLGSAYTGSLNREYIDALFVSGVILHGLIFGLFFVGGQMYTAQKAPKELQAQAQGMLAFILWGGATLVANFLCTTLIEANTRAVIAASPGGAVASAAENLQQETDWEPVFLVATIVSAIAFTFFLVFFKEGKEPGKRIA